MRADLDERPQRGRGAGESGERLIRWGFWGVLVALILYTTQPELVARLRDRFFASAPAHQQAAPPAPVSVPPPPVEPPGEYESTISEADRAAARSIAQGQTAAASDERQTSFSDDNYVPRRDVNVMESRHVREYARTESRRVESPRSRGLNGTGQVTVKWEDARRRVTRWRTSYTYRNSRIDNASFCSNYRRGSIEYRTCRKAAKAWLGERCGNANRVGSERQRMYCHAHNGFTH